MFSRRAMVTPDSHYDMAVLTARTVISSDEQYCTYTYVQSPMYDIDFNFTVEILEISTAPMQG